GAVDPDGRRSRNWSGARGALVEDVTEGSPGQRAGLRAYDIIVSLDDHGVANDDQLIREISTRTPGSPARIRLVRDGHEQTITLKLAERPAREGFDRKAEALPPPAPIAPKKSDPDGMLGLSVRDLDRATAERLDLPRVMKGVLVTRVEPMSSSFDADVQRGNVLLEINRQPIESIADFRRIARSAQPGEILTLYVYGPDVEQRQVNTIRVDDPYGHARRQHQPPL